MLVFHGTCARNAAKIMKTRLRVESYVTDDSQLAEEFASVCRCTPRCERGAVLVARVDAREVDGSPDDEGFPILGMITRKPIASARIALIWCDLP